MVGGVNIELFEFQEDASLKLIDLTSNENSKQVITMKAPTGAGKTIILINYIEEYLSKIDKNVAFIWLCPGKGDLEEQSRMKMRKFAPHRHTQNLLNAIQSGFPTESTTFINWELVTKSGNTALRDGEKKNLFDRIAEAHRNNVRFIIIIDEEHSNNTAKAKSIIDAFSAKNIIRVSATAIENKRFEYFEVDELEVINAGLITKALYVNEGLEEGTEVDDDYDYLLDRADSKRKEIFANYQSLGKNIRPLVLIQFPNGKPETILAVESKLKDMGYTYDNGMVSKWMSEDKRDLPENLTENNATPIFLLMKQAISTGWDCPRAKILVKLREGMSESFEIQTIGRIRRMPEAKHYENDIIDFCFVYTLDKKYKAGLLATVDKAYETRRLFLKQKCKDFSIQKETRDLDFDGLGEREIMVKIYDYLTQKYSLGKDKKQNKLLLQDKGYIFGDTIFEQAISGVFVKSDSVAVSDSYKSIYKNVNTHKHGIYLLHSIDTIKKTISMKSGKVKTILERLFRKSSNMTKKIISLETREFYAFIINNVDKLKEEFRAVTSQMAMQMEMRINPKKAIFKIPEQDFYKYDAGVKDEIEYSSNAYEDYTSGNATSLIRSVSEMLFEQYCETRDDIDWVYKNGDSGQQYFSVVYIDALQHQWLFYADYIVQKKDGSIWIIETKGGESKGKDKNIDKQIENKFIAFKRYAKEYNINWGFVRDKDNRLYINNTEFALDMADDNWKELKRVF